MYHHSTVYCGGVYNAVYQLQLVGSRGRSRPKYLGGGNTPTKSRRREWSGVWGGVSPPQLTRVLGSPSGVRGNVGPHKISGKKIVGYF